MILELKDDEILDFLMTSDFDGDYSPTELKYLLTKWRYFYRLHRGTLERDVNDLEGKVKQLEEKLKIEQSKVADLMVENAEKQNTIDSMKSRNLSFKERWTGKIIEKNDNPINEN